MDMFRRILFAAVLAGAVAGLVLAGLQQWRTVPLIAAAEHYEQAGAHTHASDTMAGHAQKGAHETAWSPAPGFERTAYTIAATLLTAIGFMLVVAAISVLTGLDITPANGVIWGLAAYLAFSAAPALGLPPELPGMPGGDLTARQIWWWMTALLTGGAALLIAFKPTPVFIAAAAVLAVLPQMWGPQGAQALSSNVPATLANDFAAEVLGANLVFWLIAPPLYGWLLQRIKD